MPSKYDTILPKLPELPVQDQDYQSKVEATKTLLRQDLTSTTALAKEYAALRKTKESIEEELSATNLSLEACTQMLIESQEADEPEWGTYGASSNTLRLVSGDKIEVRKEPYATVEDKDANRQWAIAQGLERLLGLPWQTINSITKELLLKGMPEPKGVKAYVKTKIVFTRMKEK